MKKYKVLACKVLMRELYSLAARSSNIIDIKWLEQQLHNTPEKLNEQLQLEIEQVENENYEYDAILLGYGLCSNGIIGIKSMKTPIVIPRGHDCLTLLLGDRRKYKDIFDEYNGGIYWYSPGWIEHCLQPSKERYEKTYTNYLDKYGLENAKYLMDMEQNWMKEYSCALYVTLDGFDNEEYIKYTKECARYLGWDYIQEDGNTSLLENMLEGRWDDDEFLIVYPDMHVIASHNDNIIGVVTDG